MDMDYPIDLNEVMDMVQQSDVLIVRFFTLSRRLLVDFRPSDRTPPFAGLVRRARSAEDRFRELGKIRPGLQMPDEIITFQWPNPVASFHRLKVTDAITERFTRMGYPHMEQRCRNVFAEMAAMEREELKAAVRGEGYNALWQRAPAEQGGS